MYTGDYIYCTTYGSLILEPTCRPQRTKPRPISERNPSKKIVYIPTTSYAAAYYTDARGRNN